MDPSPVKLPVHDHLLYSSSRFITAFCHKCLTEGPMYEGYSCNEYECNKVWFHKKCAQSPPEINHSSNQDDSLELGKGRRCRLCGERSVKSGYYCYLCKFHLDTRCGRKLSYKPTETVIEDLTSHVHPLTLSKTFACMAPHPCQVCDLIIRSHQPSYECAQCDVIFHLECLNLSVEVNHSSHPLHSLKIISRSEFLPCDAEKECILCGEELKKSLYHCSICNFSLCLCCVRNPPPLSIEHFKTHSHRLILLASQVEFTCRVCGMQGDRSPYLCLPCGLMVHRNCIDLPRVISINRHDHRVSFTPHLGSGDSKCPICRKDINRYYGAYSCSTCEDYDVHSHCATRDDVWDGIELEEIPLDTDDLASFTVEGDNLIRHFLHDKHILRLKEDGLTMNNNTRCESCVFPVYSDPIYSCEQCDFVLHEICVKLPKKKRNMFHVRPLPLKGHTYDDLNSLKNWFQCQICNAVSSGFRYEYDNFYYMDVICSSFSEPFSRHDPFPPLYLSEKAEESICTSCGKLIRERRKMCSEDGNFFLDFRCAYLPKTVKHRYDKHPLSLCYGEDVSGKYWCEICEEEVDSKRWFYTCSDCGTTLHIDCVLGDFSNIKPGCIYKYKDYDVEVVSNDHSFRPFCEECGFRCRGPFFVKVKQSKIEYVCSLICVMACLKRHIIPLYILLYP